MRQFASKSEQTDFAIVVMKKDFRKKVLKRLMSVLVLVGSLCSSDATGSMANCFSEDFEGNLSQWMGKYEQDHNGILVSDPLNDGHGTVLTFTSLSYGGDIFSSAPIACTGMVTVGFDYAGVPMPGGIAGDKGGFLGIAPASAPVGEDVVWFAGTIDDYPGLLIPLEDDGAWHHYEFTFNSADFGPFRLVMEDFGGSGGIAGDVFFDNIFVECESSAVPEPTAAALAMAGGLGMILARRKS